MPKTTERRAEATPHFDSTKRKRITQEDIVLTHLREYGSITSIQAFKFHDITRLSAVIFNLREEGYDIPMTWETSKNGKRYGRYFLREESA